MSSAIALIAVLLCCVLASPLPSLHDRNAGEIYPRTNTTNTTNTAYRAVAYFGNWDIYGRKFMPNNVPADLLTHVLYSFANVKPTGEVFLSDTYADIEKHYPGDSWSETGNNVYGSLKQFYLLKKKNRNMKVMLSIGGWTYANQSGVFDAVSTESGRANFTASSIKLLQDLGFDGLDIDWEYPANSTQAQNYVQLLQNLREGLTNYTNTLSDKPHFLVSVAAPAGPLNYQLWNITGMDPHVDMWNLMAYDYTGSWDTVAGHMANINKSPQDPASTPFNTFEPASFYTVKGVHPNKLNLGMPLYGRAFQNTDGPGKVFNGVGPGRWEAGVWDYKDLPRAGATVHADTEIVASWSYDNRTREMISYDTPEIATLKTDYIKSKCLGGAMWWDVSGDRPSTDSQSLIKVVVEALGGRNGTQMEKVLNVLNYPSSQYDNLRREMVDV